MATIERLVHFTDPQSMDYNKENLSFYGNDREVGTFHWPPVHGIPRMDLTEMDYLNGRVNDQLNGLP